MKFCGGCVCVIEDVAVAGVVPWVTASVCSEVGGGVGVIVL